MVGSEYLWPCVSRSVYISPRVNMRGSCWTGFTGDQKLGRSVMTKGNSGNRILTEVGARAVRLILENEADCRTRFESFRSISKKIGCSTETLRDWVNKQSIETGHREGLTLSERTQMKELQRENRPRRLRKRRS